MLLQPLGDAANQLAFPRCHRQAKVALRKAPLVPQCHERAGGRSCWENGDGAGDAAQWLGPLLPEQTWQPEIRWVFALKILRQIQGFQGMTLA